MYRPPAMTRVREIRTKGPSFSALHLLFVLLLFGTCSGRLNALGGDRSALLRFKTSVSDPSGLLAAWSAADCCSWLGVHCDSRMRVVAVNISAASSSPCPLSGPIRRRCPDLSRKLSGPLPAALSELTELKVLSLPFNAFSGEIPAEIWRLESLEVVDLEGNSLSGSLPLRFPRGLRVLNLGFNQIKGEIPSSLSSCLDLETLDLSGNQLTGVIPGGLAELKNLTVLLLDNNKLTGKIPNVSFNNLSGLLPFNSSKLACDTSIVSLSGSPSDPQGLVGDSVSPPPPAKSGNGGFSSIEIASIASASAIVSVLLALIVVYMYTRKCAPRAARQSSGQNEVAVFTDIGVPITYESVLRATGGFNASNCIGSGGFGATYKAEISPGVLVAIKRLSVGRLQGVQQFHAEIKTLGRWRHPNLVTLIGYHLSDAEMFLIYNYLPGGNLERFIQQRSQRSTDWRMIHKIALDVARALAYLHDHCVPRILHRDVKPSNILLDNDCNAYLSDFGLARLLGNSETHATTGVAGTFGYVAPEYAMTCRVSDKADVYSYGVVLLELLSDKKALDPSFSPYGNGFNIVAWACMLLRQGRAHEFFIEGLWDVGPHDDLVDTLHLAVKCTVDSLSIRPTMKQVVQRLKHLQPPNRLARTAAPVI